MKPSDHDHRAGHLGDAAGSVQDERRAVDPSSSGSIWVGLADHLGWANTIAVTSELEVVDRRRIEMVAPGLPAAPIHHEGGPHAMHRSGDPLDDAELAALVERVRSSAASVIERELDRLAADLPGPIAAISVRAWPADFPTDIATQRRVPYESRADPVMYRTALAAAATARGWTVNYFDPKTVTENALRLIGATDDAVLRAPGRRLGPPWGTDQRLALAAAVVARSHGPEPRR